MTFEQNNATKLQLTERLQKYGIVIILIIFAGLSVLYDVTVPFFEKPDELKHFAVVQYIQTQRQLPMVREGVYKPWDQEGTQPPLYHILSAVLTAPLNLSRFNEPPRNPHYVDDRSFVWRERGNNNLYLHPPGENWSTDPVFLAARTARWLSILAGMMTIFLTYFLAKIIFNCTWFSKPKKNGFTNQNPRLFCYIPLLAATLIALVPQYLHVSSAITNDSLAVTLAAGALVVLALMVREGLSTKTTVLLGLLLGLGAITKLSLLYLVVPTGLVFLLDLYRRRSLAVVLKNGVIVVGVALLLSGWWFLRNWQLYGDPTALNAHLLYRGGALNPTPSLAQIWQTERVGLELSFWAAFGAGQILLEPLIYRGLGWLKAVILGGMLIGVWQLFRRQRVAAGEETDRDSSAVISLALPALWCILIFAALLRWMQITPASWGRLLYPALPALAVLSAWGLVQFPGPGANLMSSAQSSSKKYVFGFFRLMLNAIPWLVVLLLFCLALTGPFRYIPAAYAKAPLTTEAELPPDINRLDYTFAGGALRLLGYRVEQHTALPGTWLPVTLYWQATQPIETNYSTFVHVLDKQGQALAQTNTYPDGGNWPASMLPPGAVLADTIHIFLPPNMIAPAETRLAIGAFDYNDPQRAALPAENFAGKPVEPIVPGPPVVPPEWPLLTPATPMAANFADQIQLIGLDWTNEAVKPGDDIPLTLYWYTMSAPERQLNLFIHLIDPATQTQVAGFDGPPAFGTGNWQPGATVADARILAIPADLPAGAYNLVIGWYDLADFTRLPLASPHSGDSLLLTEVNVK